MQWLVRARDDLRVWNTIERFEPGDELAEIRVTGSTRKKHPELPETSRIRVISYRRAGFKTRTLVASLLDPKLYPAREVAELYHERWELELAYDEIKTQTLDRREAIRSPSPDRVRQEILGLMIAYNLVRREMEGMALKLELPANRISFQATLMMMRDLFYWAEVASPGKLPLMLAQMRLKLETFVLPPRRQRRYPRVTKMRVGKYGLTKERKTQGS
ncbi:MAG: transposase [Elusimicrobiota bacterium]|nr:transposase [Elusimicrobiota bacterium]